MKIEHKLKSAIVSKINYFALINANQINSSELAFIFDINATLTEVSYSIAVI